MNFIKVGPKALSSTMRNQLIDCAKTYTNEITHKLVMEHQHLLPDYESGVRYSIDIFLGLTHLFNEETKENIEKSIEVSYINYVIKLMSLVNPTGNEIHNYDKINHFFTALSITDEEFLLCELYFLDTDSHTLIQ